MIKSYIEANDATDVIEIIEKDPVDLTKEDLGSAEVCTYI